MSYEYGMAALNLEMPPRIPRTEYSATEHWPLVEAVTGIAADPADKQLCEKARRKFVEIWHYDLMWNTLISGNEFGNFITRMGHAVYAANGADFDREVSELFANPEDAYDFDFYESLGAKDCSGLVRRFDENYDAMAAAYPDMVNMTGVYITCMSGLIDLLGWEALLVAAGLDGKRFGDLADRYAKWIEQYYIALSKCKSPVVMVHDDIVWTSGAFISPDWYRRHIFPNYKMLFRHLHEAGKKIIYTSDGDYTEFVDDIAGCGVNCFVLEPLTDMAYIAERYGKTHSFIGNADTRVLLAGSKDDIYNEVKRCVGIGKNCPGFFMAVGNHIPANTPVDNALYYNDAYEKLCRR